MSPSQLIEWLNNPGLLDKDSLVQLRLLLESYPCFAPARMLYLKNLAVQKDLRYSSELIRTAISVPDRRCLFRFMEDRLEKAGQAAQPEAVSSEKDSFSIIDHFLHTSAPTSAEEAPDELVTKFIMTTAQPPASDQGPEQLEKAPASKPEQSETAPASKPESRKQQTDKIADAINDYELGSFTLDYLSFQALHSNDQLQQESGEQLGKAQASVAQLHGQELIDAFLSKEEAPGRNRPAPDVSAPEVSASDVSTVEASAPVSESPEQPSEGDPEAFEEEDKPIQEASFSETLARIYIKQKRYDRALEIIKTLSLKYPEKNVYFADQIRYLEKLIIHTKNN